MNILRVEPFTFVAAGIAMASFGAAFVAMDREIDKELSEETKRKIVNLRPKKPETLFQLNELLKAASTSLNVKKKKY